MKIKNYFFVASIILLCNAFKAQQFQTGKAQIKNDLEWIPVLISHDGTNTNEGIEASYALTNCGGNETVLLKLKNTNNFSVKTQWVNQVITKDGKENYGNSKITFFALPPNSEKAGDCSGNNFPLVIKLNDFAVQANNFETFIGSNFFVIKPSNVNTK